LVGRKGAQKKRGRKKGDSEGTGAFLAEAANVRVVEWFAGA
jgi:hypothetical protein